MSPGNHTLPLWLEGCAARYTRFERFLLWWENKIPILRVPKYRERLSWQRLIVSIMELDAVYYDPSSNHVIYATPWRSRLIRVLRWLRYTSIQTRLSDPLREMSFKREDYDRNYKP